jgi:hypothetical protein
VDTECGVKCGERHVSFLSVTILAKRYARGALNYLGAEGLKRRVNFKRADQRFYSLKRVEIVDTKLPRTEISAEQHARLPLLT